jgi:hypothetical protein
MNDEISEIINEGLYFYEQDLKRGVSGGVATKKVETVSGEQFAAMQEANNNIKASPSTTSSLSTKMARQLKVVTKELGNSSSKPPSASSPQAIAAATSGSSSRRFVPASAMSAASPPVGWLMSHAAMVAAGSSPIATSPPPHLLSPVAPVPTPTSPLTGDKLSFKEFPVFQHPSHELLRENGFVQQKYHKYHAKALKGKEKKNITFEW